MLSRRVEWFPLETFTLEIVFLNFVQVLIKSTVDGHPKKKNKSSWIPHPAVRHLPARALKYLGSLSWRAIVGLGLDQDI